MGFLGRFWSSSTRIWDGFHGRIVGIGVLVVLLAGSVGIWTVERNSEGPIDNYADALWWSMTTVTTVGYGDMYPGHARRPSDRHVPDAGRNRHLRCRGCQPRLAVHPVNRSRTTIKNCSSVSMSSPHRSQNLRRSVRIATPDRRPNATGAVTFRKGGVPTHYRALDKGRTVAVELAPWAGTQHPISGGVARLGHSKTDRWGCAASQRALTGRSRPG